MNIAAPLRSRWDALAAREKVLVGGAAVLVAAVMVWLVALGPALATLRTAEDQHRTVDAQLQQMLILQKQAQLLQAQPKQSHDEALRLLELSVRQRLGASARLLVSGDRATLTLTGTAADTLAQWLTQARVDARALPSEAHLNRNPAGLWEGTLVLNLPPR
jgi:general secretion pathway protein M